MLVAMVVLRMQAWHGEKCQRGSERSTLCGGWLSRCHFPLCAFSNSLCVHSQTPSVCILKLPLCGFSTPSVCLLKLPLCGFSNSLCVHSELWDVLPSAFKEACVLGIRMRLAHAIQEQDGWAHVQWSVCEYSVKMWWLISCHSIHWQG